MEIGATVRAVGNFIPVRRYSPGELSYQAKGRVLGYDLLGSLVEGAGWESMEFALRALIVFILLLAFFPPSFLRPHKKKR